MSYKLFLLIAGSLLLACSPETSAPERAAGKQIVDLTHEFSEDTIYWPTDTRGFQFEQLCRCGSLQRSTENKVQGQDTT